MYRRRQLRFRAGNINAAGGQPINAMSRIIKTITAGAFGVTVTTAGNTGIFDIAQMGTPADMPTTTFTVLGTAANHPSEHPEMLTSGFETARVLSSLYRFHVRFRGTNAAIKDYIFAYKFGPVSTSAGPAAGVFTAGDVTIDYWKDMRQSRGWVWHRFSGTNTGGSSYASQGLVEIRVPSVLRLANELFEDVELTAPMTELLEMNITDAANTSGIRPFLHIAIFTVEGEAFAALDVWTEVEVFQTLKISRSISNALMIDEADQVS